MYLKQQLCHPGRRAQVGPSGSLWPPQHLWLQPRRFLHPWVLPSPSQLPGSETSLFNVALFNCQLLHHSLSINDLDNTLAHRQRWGDCDLRSDVCYSLISLSCGCFANIPFYVQTTTFCTPPAHAKPLSPFLLANSSGSLTTPWLFLGQGPQETLGKGDPPKQNCSPAEGRSPALLIAPLQEPSPNSKM